MLTYLEVDGFKNLRNESFYFGPVTALGGVVGTGKSNVLDAIEFLGHLARLPLHDAAQMIRPTATCDHYNHIDLFRQFANSRRTQPMRFTAEMLLPLSVEDDLGRPVTPTATYVRYEIAIRYEQESGHLRVESESLRTLSHSEALNRLSFDPGFAFLESAVKTAPQSVPLLTPDGDKTIIHRDGKGGAGPREAKRLEMAKTCVATVSDDAFPTVQAARREMQSWSRLTLSPQAMRSSDTNDMLAAMTYSGKFLSSDGRYMPALLAAASAAHDGGLSPEDRVSAALNRMAGVTDRYRVQVSVATHSLEAVSLLFWDNHTDACMTAQSMSDGLLKRTALALLGEDRRDHAVYCIDSLDDGLTLHMAAVGEHLRMVAVSPESAVSEKNRLRQVIIELHDPDAWRAFHDSLRIIQHDGDW